MESSRDHKKRHLPSNAKRHQCAHCGEGFATLPAVERHAKPCAERRAKAGLPDAVTFKLPWEGR